MDKKILPFLVLLLTFFVVIPIYGTNHYVDKMHQAAITVTVGVMRGKTTVQ